MARSRSFNDDYTVAEIAALLRDRIDSLVVDLFPNGYREGSEWRIGSVEGEPGSSLGIRLTGAKAGKWKDFSSGAHGDPIDLIRGSQGFATLGEAVRWAKRWLGIERGQARVRPSKTAAELAAEDLKEAEARRERAFEIWQDASPIDGTLTETYLRARGLQVQTPSTIRHHPRVRFTPGGEKVFLPAMVCAVQSGDDGRFLGIHRTYLDPTKPGRRLQHDDAKMTLGPIRGGAIRLSRAAPVWMPGEGVETMLSVLQSYPERMVWAVISASLMRVVRLPACEHAIICADHDEPQRVGPRAGIKEGLDAAKALAGRIYEERGKAVRVQIAQPEREGQDFNDVIRRGDVHV